MTRSTTGKKLEPYVDNVQAHYDLSDEFFELFLDPEVVPARIE